MIVACPNCKKKFKIDPTLVPEDGRDLQCGSCQHIWFYKLVNEKFSSISQNEDSINKIVEDNLSKKNNKNKTEDNKSILDKKPKNYKENNNYTILENKKTHNKKENVNSKFFSYLIVLIISFVAFIILVDTLKTPIIDVFPGAEVILFNLFETLKDIKLFIIDLT